jgi:hypothetical protein
VAYCKFSSRVAGWPIDESSVEWLGQGKVSCLFACAGEDLVLEVLIARCCETL